MADRGPEGDMRFKTIAVTVTAAAALWLGMAGSAMASPLTSRPAPQVTGTRLQSALLPTSAFGDGLTVADRLNTGKKLWSTRVLIKPSSLSCAKFEEYIYVGGFGNTAGATEDFQNPNPNLAAYPEIVFGGDQAVLQFNTAKAATTFYNRAYTRYNQCRDFTESAGSDQLALSTVSLDKTTVGKNAAIQIVQTVILSSVPTVSLYVDTTVVLAGTNVYTIDELTGVNSPIYPPLLARLISRVQALYRHR